MKPTARSSSPLVGAALVMWAVAGLPQAEIWVSGHAPHNRPSLLPFDQVSLLWCAAYGTFAVAFLFASATDRFVTWRRTAMTVQSAAALTVLALGNTGFEGVLLCVVAGEAPLVVGEKTGLFWMIAQTVGMVAVNRVSPFHSRANVVSTIVYAGFEVFAFGAARLAVREATARVELARVHAELVATQELFADRFGRPSACASRASFTTPLATT